MPYWEYGASPNQARVRNLVFWLVFLKRYVFNPKGGVSTDSNQCFPSNHREGSASANCSFLVPEGYPIPTAAPENLLWRLAHGWRAGVSCNRVLPKRPFPRKARQLPEVYGSLYLQHRNEKPGHIHTHAGVCRATFCSGEWDVMLVANVAKTPALRRTPAGGKQGRPHVDGVEWERSEWGTNRPPLFSLERRLAVDRSANYHRRGRDAGIT